MNLELEKNKYYIVRDVISEETKKLFETYLWIKFFVKQDYNFSGGELVKDPDAVQPFSKSTYADPMCESLLKMLLTKMREVTDLPNLHPSYSFLRYYEKGQWLNAHVDRPSCQYSITLPLLSFDDTPWSIFVGGKEVNLNIGDLVVYKGCEVTHWREPYEGQFQVQAHLHYVNGDDPAYASYILDKRESLGMDF